MLSKKMAFSLTSLIAIVMLAFVAPAVLAASFEVGLSEDASQPDIGAAPGLQLEHPGDTLKVKVMFGEFVKLAKVDTNIDVAGFDKNGDYIPDVKLKEVTPNDKAAAEFTVAITINAATSRVTLMIKKDIASANAFSNNKSEALPATDIFLYASDVDITPKVYGIKRADGSGLPLTSGAVDVVITLSEEPETFTAAHINVMGATAGTPVKLATIRQNAVGLTQFATHIGNPEVKEAKLAEIRDGIATDPKLTGIEYYLSVAANTAHDNAPDYRATFTGDSASRKDYRAEIMALETALGTADQNFNYHWLKDNAIQTAVLEHGDAQTGTNENNVKAMPIVDNVLQKPTTWATDTANNALTGSHPENNGVTVTIPPEQFDRSSKKATHKDGEKPPKLGDFTTVDAFNFATAAYNARHGTAANNERDRYANEKKVYDTYKALQDAIAKNRMEQREHWKETVITAAAKGETTQIADNVLPPTGRDGMLHPYSVTITPTYASSSVVVKVNRWQNAALTPARYIPPTLETAYREGYDMLTIPVTPAAATPAVVQPDGVIVFTLPAGAFK